MKTTLKIVIYLLAGLSMLPQSGVAGEWGIGMAAAYIQPPHTGVDSDVRALPYVTYHGEHFNLDLGTVTYTLHQTGTMKIALEGELRFDGYEPQDSPALAGMAERRPSFDAGLSLARTDSTGEMKIMILGDITGTHEGVEARAQYQIPYMINRMFIAPAVGVSWLSSDLVDYYYGVRANEVTGNRAYYTGEAVTNIFVDLAVGYQISERVELLGGLKVTRMGKNITASPIVDKKHDTCAFTTLQYKF
ncbi:MAG: MipA/OmpV family protein [Gammaproteobacteria bacterium]|nr:MipA/OmpV family protein [Gammaproteobacteria bacterium]MDH5653944.1 MipA/OmpV family protein [Gammaproteobacteria bacterium]